MTSPSPSNSDETPWDQTVDFLEATDTVVRPGGPTAYIEPRPVGSTATDVTSFIPGQAAWTSNNWPNILYTLRPPPGWENFRQSPPPPLKRDTEGNIIYESNPLPAKPGKRARKAKPLRDFTILPDIIGTRNPWWYYEAIRRIDPRVCWSDILMRMPLEGRRRQNALNMESSRMRPRYNMVSWHPTSDESRENEIRQRVMRNLSPQQIAANTTRGTTPGLINPLQGEAGGRIAHLILRNGQGQVRGSRPQKSRKTKNTINPTNSDPQAENGQEEYTEEQDEVHEEPRFEPFPRAHHPSDALYPATNHQNTRQAINVIGGQDHIQSILSQARSSRDARLPPFDYFPGEVRVEEQYGLRKRKGAFGTTALTEDEETEAAVDHLPRRRVTARSNSNTPFTLGGGSHIRGGPIDWSILTQGMGGVRPPGRVPSGSQSSRTQSSLSPRAAPPVPPREEMGSVRRPGHTPFGPSQQDGETNWDPPYRHYHSSRQRRANFTERPGGHDSFRMGGRQYLPIASNHPRPSSWEYEQHAPTHRQAANNPHLTSRDGAIPAPRYPGNVSAFQAQQDPITRQPIYTVASNFNFGVTQEQLRTRYTSPPLLSAEESRNVWSGEEDVVWGNRTFTTPRYTDVEAFGPGLQGRDYLRPARASQRPQPNVNSTPRHRLQDQGPAPAPLSNPFFGYNDEDRAAYKESD